MTTGSQQSLVVVAQTGTRLANGTMIHETDSQAVQITANITGSRSINAMNALTGTMSGRPARRALTPLIAGIVQGAGIFTGFVGSARPTLQTDGNFTAVTGDIYRMSDLFKAARRPDRRSPDIAWLWGLWLKAIPAATSG